MKTEQIQTLNYCTRAIEDIKEMRNKIRDSMPQTAEVYRRLIEMLEQSVKFILPNCCNLVAANEFKQEHLNLMKLPYPLVAFEAPWETEEDSLIKSGEFKQQTSNKRISLCWEASPKYELLPGLNNVLSSFPEGGIFVVPIYWMSDHQGWFVGMGGCFVPYKNEVFQRKTEESPPASQLANQASIDAGLAKEDALHYRAEPFYLLPEFFHRAVNNAGGNTDTVFAHMLLDSRDETGMMVQACSVLNCANVTTGIIDPPIALNKKRAAKGKKPLFSYHVLQLVVGKGDKSESAGGNHASPRMHLRRGHLRRLETKTVWVRPAMINIGSNSGSVAKDYSIVKR